MTKQEYRSEKEFVTMLDVFLETRPSSKALAHVLNHKLQTWEFRNILTAKGIWNILQKEYKDLKDVPQPSQDFCYTNEAITKAAAYYLGKKRQEQDEAYKEHLRNTAVPLEPEKETTDDISTI